MKLTFRPLPSTLLSCALYLIAFWLYRTTGLQLPLELAALFLLLVIVPGRLIQLLRLELANHAEYLLALATCYFFLFVPLLYVCTAFLNLALNPLLIGAVSFIILAIASFFPGQSIDWLSTLTWKKLRMAWPLWVTFLLYLGLHTLYYHFYHFIPEWDSYAKLTEISNVLQTGVLGVSYRGFFTASQAILASFGAINPYRLFSFWMIIFQFLPTVALYLLTLKYQLTKKWQFIALFGTLAIPVLAMEIDVVRPQSIALMFFPVFAYFLYQGIQTKRATYWLLSSLIAFFGLNYHEFFIILFLTQLGWICYYVVQRYHHIANRREQNMLIVVAILSVALFFSLVSNISAIQFGLRFVKNILLQISYVGSWKLWFLSNYNTDGTALSIGWPGWQGALKYYAYYASPYISLIGALVISRKHFRFWRDRLWQVILPGIAIFLGVAEVLPRLNFIYLPERTWVFTDVLLLLGSIPLYAFLQKKLKPHQTSLAVILLTVSMMIGLAGSLYVAHSKSAVTSVNEYQAALWIRQNTPENSLFITQASNGPMITYFAARTFNVPTKASFFLSPTLQTMPLPTSLAQEKTDLDQKVQNSLNLYQETRNNNYNNFDLFIQSINDLSQETLLLGDQLNGKPAIPIPTYILFSEDKFKGLYAGRAWWQVANYAGANLEKFNQAYPIVYNQNGVRIWRVPNN